MKIGIVGGGAVGLFFAVNLAEHFPVVLFTRTEEQAAFINEHGILIKEGGQSSACSLQASPADQLPMHSLDYIFIAVKQYKLPAVLSVLERCGSNPALIFLQNGMSHIKALATLPHPHIYVAAVEHGVIKSGPAHVEVRGRGKTNVAVYRGDRQFMEALEEQTKGSFPFEWHADYEAMLLGKLAANTVINPLTAILRVRNGELVSNPHYTKLAKTVYQEFAAVFINKIKANTWNEIMYICRTTANNRSSMLKDIESGRPTEADAILGYVLSQADEKEMQLPVLAALYSMIKGLEQGEAE